MSHASRAQLRFREQRSPALIPSISALDAAVKEQAPAADAGGGDTG